jgi:hypothetical protein
LFILPVFIPIKRQEWLKIKLSHWTFPAFQSGKNPATGRIWGGKDSGKQPHIPQFSILF